MARMTDAEKAVRQELHRILHSNADIEKAMNMWERGYLTFNELMEYVARETLNQCLRMKEV